MKNNTDTVVPFLEHVAYELRRNSIIMTTQAGSGHPTSAASAADIVAVLFFHTMRYDPAHFNNPNNDRFILSKGHAAPVLYAAWKQAGMLTEKDLLGYRRIDSPLEGHPTLRFSHAEAATGSLGIGLSIGVGEALAAKMDTRTYVTYVLMGDSEISEGSVWEAAQLATFYKLNNLIALVDCNRLGQSTPTMAALEGNEPARFEKMFAAFGWQPYIVDGHDVAALMAVFSQARTSDKPVVIIAKTKKGYGIAPAEDKENFHGKAFSKDECDGVLKELKKRFARAAAYDGKYEWKPTMPDSAKPLASAPEKIMIKESSYALGTQVPTRKAFGQALVQLGAANQQVVSLDAEVKNSTYAELFEQAYPQRFVQCFIAEQNMIGMAVGLERRGKIPFVSTFGAFFTRAHDQVRMAAIGTAPLRLVGSHAGVSIGQDGPSQMALEDIAMMRALPNSIVLYPSDAVSTHALVEQMGRYAKGISYLRTTRMATPVIYKAGEKFVVGGCKVVRQSDRDKVCIVAAGVTLFEALAAYEKLSSDNDPIMISVIDAYSIKPLDADTIAKVANASGKKLITVEDHYSEGGLGEAVAAALCNKNILIKRLAVTQLPRSGQPEELLALAGIDASAIIKQVRELVSL